ncbi:hypothetical protein IE53DRAFT_119041 [Violaceomyces palustris]|uniref:Uncharacterized protein n=1 Tax=Violaceomyces palustris TaxID=1673888 RepID=A0ACD0NVY5_9BASI|nr:hypothetical protein IE53DRAFT_119041 [Violaceomyces palustris]
MDRFEWKRIGQGRVGGILPRMITFLARTRTVSCLLSLNVIEVSHKIGWLVGWWVAVICQGKLTGPNYETPPPKIPLRASFHFALT